jgi:hypothetical protein
LKILTRFYATPAENALVGVIPIERVGKIGFIGLGAERCLLMLDLQQFGCVVNSAIAIVVVANGAVELVIPEDPVKRFPLGCLGGYRFSEYFHAG